MKITAKLHILRYFYCGRIHFSSLKTEAVVIVPLVVCRISTATATPTPITLPCFSMYIRIGEGRTSLEKETANFFRSLLAKITTFYLHNRKFSFNQNVFYRFSYPSDAITGHFNLFFTIIQNFSYRSWRSGRLPWPM